MNYLEYLDAQVSYVLPRISSDSNKAYFVLGIAKVKETYNLNKHLMPVIKGFKNDCPRNLFWIKPEKYYEMGLSVGNELYTSLKNKGFNI